jgi:hypothetical protein
MNLPSIERQNPKIKYATEDKSNLTLLVLILGILSIISLGILMLSFLRQLYPQGFAAINKQLNYQGKLQDADGITVPDGSYNIKFTIYDAASGGNILWTARESDGCGAPFNPTAKSISVTSGVFSTLLGETGDCALNLDFNSDTYYLGITVGTDSEMTPRKRIGAAGYAFNADLLDGVSEEYFAQLAQNETVTGSWIFGDANTDTLTLTAYINSDVYIGANAETIDNIGFVMDGNDVFIAGMLGVEGDIYTDGSFISGASTTYGDGSITTTGTTDLVINPAGGDVSITDDNFSVDTDVLYVDAVGNFVGVGTAIPSYTLDVSSSGARAINAATSNTNGYGVYASATATGAVANYGGWFEAYGDSGYGVYGLALATGAVTNYGGYFATNGDTGRGVYGWASATGAVTNYGGYFTTAGNSGRGVYGYASATGAVLNIGGEFWANGNSGFGVYGSALATGAVTNYGGYFDTYGDSGRAVYGEAYATTGATNYGGYFRSRGDLGFGVYGWASATGAVTNYGGYFTAAGDSGFGVYGTGNSYGGYFKGTGSGGYGVYGWASDTIAFNYGGYFQADGIAGSYGVYGNASANTAIDNYGGYFIAQGTNGAVGVKGVAPGAGSVYGVYGQATATGAVANYGGYFTAAGDSGLAVVGAATATSATSNYGGYFTAAGDFGYGVYGEASATGANVNFGGFFIAQGTATSTSAVYGAAPGAGEVYGVEGYAGASGAFTNYGGYFRANGDTGRGVFGSANAAGAFANYGGVFEAYGDSGAGIYSSAYATGAVTNYGGLFDVWGDSGRGIYSIASSTDGAATNYGGYFEAYGGLGYGVYGSAHATGAVTNYGGYFKSNGDSGYGVYGEAGASGAVTNYGGYFKAGGSNGYGVYGEASQPGGVSYGGYFKGSDYGVYAMAVDSSNGIAVYADGTPSTNWSGYFTGGQGVYTSKSFVNRTTPGTYDSLYSLIVEGAVCVDDGTSNCPDAPTSGGIYVEESIGTGNVSAFDIAEFYPSSEKVEPGDLLVLDRGNTKKVKKSSQPYEPFIIGVVSTNPAIVMDEERIVMGKNAGKNFDPLKPYVALAGRVLVKVSTENGSIQIGDKLTTSSIPGVAMKTTKSGPVVGMALEPWNGSGVGEIMVFASVDWSNGDGVTAETVATTPASSSGYKVVLDKLTTDLDANNFTISNIKKIVSKDEVWSIDENGVLKVKIAVENGDQNANKKEKEIFGLSSTQVEIVLSGSGKLEKGEALIDFAKVELDSENKSGANFTDIVDPEIPLKIILTPTEPTRGLYVAEKYSQGFKAKELDGGTSNATFDWIVIGRRKGY